MQNVCLLGATGSVGKSALEVLALYPEKFRLFSVAAHSNVQKLADIAVRFNVRRVGIADVAKTDELARLLKEAGRGDIEILSGPEAAVKLAADKEAQTVIVAVVGAAGVPATFAAAKAGKRILHANKESVVCGGAFLQQTVRENGAVMLPVDSEHNAIFQCLAGASEEDRRQCRLWLTCSGGPFRDRPELDLNTVTPAMALAHPTWQMGRKISIDSATLMNKGLEVIEARWLFDIPQDRIHVVIHPQSDEAPGRVLFRLARTTAGRDAASGSVRALPAYFQGARCGAFRAAGVCLRRAARRRYGKHCAQCG